jgi:hypothetical protein
VRLVPIVLVPFVLFCVVRLVPIVLVPFVLFCVFFSCYGIYSVGAPLFLFSAVSAIHENMF